MVCGFGDLVWFDHCAGCFAELRFMVVLAMILVLRFWVWDFAFQCFAFLSA